MYYTTSKPPVLTILILVTVLIALIISSANDDDTEYNHAAVGDIVMSIGHNCEFGVLYNSDGILMEDLEGYNIECEKITLTKVVWRNEPKMHLQEFIVERD